MHPLLLIGLALNTGLIVVNRFVIDPGNFSILCQLAAIGFMVTGLIFTVKK